MMEITQSQMLFKINTQPAVNVCGRWALQIPPDPDHEVELIISGEPQSLKAEINVIDFKIKVTTTKLEDSILTMSFPIKELGEEVTVRMSGVVDTESISGVGIDGWGRSFNWKGKLTEPSSDESIDAPTEPLKMAEFPVVYPDGAFGRTAPPAQPVTILIKNATI